MKYAAFTLFLAISITGCGKADVDGPPQVKYGRAECSECGMIVSQERYASAIVLPHGEPNRELIFDDINCMLEYEASHPLKADSRRYVHNVETFQWMPALDASFVRNPDVHTPMGSGLQAFAKPPTTMQALTYAELRSPIDQAATVPTGR